MIDSLPDDCLGAIVGRFLRERAIHTQERYFTLVYLSKRFHRLANGVPLDWSTLGCMVYGIQRWRRIAPNRKDEACWKALAGATFRQNLLRKEIEAEGGRKVKRLRRKVKEEDGVNRLRLRLRKYLLFNR
jgi:hypothetical protein